LTKHNKDFQSIEPELREFYSNHVNAQKIIILLEVWLYLYKSIYLAYGIEGLKEFSKSDYNCPLRFSFEYEFNFNYNNAKDPSNSTWLFFMLEPFLKNCLLPGSNIKNLIHKIRWRIAKLFIYSAPCQIENEKKITIMNYVYRYFNACFDVNNEIENLIKESLPTVFFEKCINTIQKKDLNVECAPNTFFEFSGFERIFLIQRSVIVKGLQHGGGYYSFLSEIAVRFEEKISNIFFGWGLSPLNNCKQHRYNRKKNNIKCNFEKRRIVWIERCRVTKLYSYLWLGDYLSLTDINPIRYIANELKLSKIPYYNMPYPKNLQLSEYDQFTQKAIVDKNNRGEDSLECGDIVIFDHLGSSMIHYCIEFEIVFLIVLSRGLVDEHTKQQLEWHDALRKANLLFYDNEVGHMKEMLIKIHGSNFKIPLTLKEYHKKTFLL